MGKKTQRHEYIMLSPEAWYSEAAVGCMGLHIHENPCKRPYGEEHMLYFCSFTLLSNSTSSSSSPSKNSKYVPFAMKCIFSAHHPNANGFLRWMILCQVKQRKKTPTINGQCSLFFTCLNIQLSRLAAPWKTLYLDEEQCIW